MSYVDGFVIPVLADKKDAYRKMAAEVAPIFREYGATRIVECWGDEVPEGKVTDFRSAVKAVAGENIVFSWIEWPSKEVRDAANQKMKDDPRMQMHVGIELPFDMKRMIIGGYSVLVDTSVQESK